MNPLWYVRPNGSKFVIRPRYRLTFEHPLTLDEYDTRELAEAALAEHTHST